MNNMFDKESKVYTEFDVLDDIYNTEYVFELHIILMKTRLSYFSNIFFEEFGNHIANKFN